MCALTSRCPLQSASSKIVSVRRWCSARATPFSMRHSYLSSSETTKRSSLIPQCSWSWISQFTWRSWNTAKMRNQLCLESKTSIGGHHFTATRLRSMRRLSRSVWRIRAHSEYSQCISTFFLLSQGRSCLPRKLLSARQVWRRNLNQKPFKDSWTMLTTGGTISRQLDSHIRIGLLRFSLRQMTASPVFTSLFAHSLAPWLQIDYSSLHYMLRGL